MAILSLKYLGNVDDLFMHLTNVYFGLRDPNYKVSEEFLSDLEADFEKHGVKIDDVWKSVEDIVIKAVIACEDELNNELTKHENNRYSVFHFFAIDVMFDFDLKPWLLEINDTPGLATKPKKVGKFIKNVLTEVLNIVNFNIPDNISEADKKLIQEELDLKDISRLTFDERLQTLEKSQEDFKKQEEVMKIFHKYSDFDSVTLQNTTLDTLTPYDVRLLIKSEDHLKECKDFVRIFPTAESSKYFKYFKKTRYNNLLLNAWEKKYGQNRSEGIQQLEKLCRNKEHLKTF